MKDKNSKHPGVTFLSNFHPVKAKEKISAIFEFTPTGRLINVFLNSKNEQDQLVLQGGIERLIRPYHLSWVKRLFR